VGCGIEIGRNPRRMRCLSCKWKRYYLTHHAEVRAKQKARYNANYKRENARARAWEAANPERARAMKRDYMRRLRGPRPICQTAGCKARIERRQVKFCLECSRFYVANRMRGAA
jgi:hypothetical protein